MRRSTALNEATDDFGEAYRFLSTAYTAFLSSPTPRMFGVLRFARSQYRASEEKRKRLLGFL